MALSDAIYINGATFGWSSVSLECNSVPFYGVKQITYSDKIEVGLGYSLTPGHAPTRRTRGKYSVDDPKVVMVLPAANEFRTALSLQALGNGYSEVIFPVTVTYSEPTLGTIVDLLEDCRIIGENVDRSEDTDESVVEFTLSCMRIKWNGSYKFRQF